MLTDEERGVLETIEKSKLLGKTELIRMIEKKVKGSPASAISNLESKRLIAKISGISIESSYIITQAGQRSLRESALSR